MWMKINVSVWILWDELFASNFEDDQIVYKKKILKDIFVFNYDPHKYIVYPNHI